jgi:glycosyltransferase involved in cell wall biosynthesis
MLSIVIPTLNEEKYLPRLLDSIQSQETLLDYEIIVCDGHSIDRTVEIARGYGCLVIESEKRSPAIQRNLGAKIAQGDVIFFSDADNILPAGFLSKSYAEFKKNNLSVAGFYLNFRSPRPIFRLFTFFYNFGCWALQWVFPVSVGVGIIVEREKHKLAGGFDEGIFIGEDYDYTKRLSQVGKYRMISSVRIIYSVRRLEKEGVITVLWKWIKGAVYFFVKGPIYKEIVKYDFGNF